MGQAAGRRDLKCQQPLVKKAVVLAIQYHVIQLEIIDDLFDWPGSVKILQFHHHRL